MNDPVMHVRDLVVDYGTPRGTVRPLDGASLVVAPGEVVGVIGESGSGKTTLGLCAGRLLAANAKHRSGSLFVAGVDVFACSPRELEQVRRGVLGYVFQNPTTALDPTMRIGRQMALATASSQARADATSPAAALSDVGLPDVARVLRAYPHELSGGMAQRVGIAMALSRHPRLMVADEPTAAVDATVRSQILDLLVTRCREERCALLLLTHDVQAVAERADTIAVMYGGRVVESGAARSVVAAPSHPYTRGLIGALPGAEAPSGRLEAIPGAPPVLVGACPGCPFEPRCRDAMPECATRRPADIVRGDRVVSCFLADPQVAAPGERADWPGECTSGPTQVAPALRRSGKARKQ
jgi:peptide/nickel transport system ATP-binding protein